MSTKAMSFDQSVEEICDAVERFRNSDMRARNCIPLDSRWSDALYPDMMFFTSQAADLIYDDDVGIFPSHTDNARRTDLLTNFGRRGLCVQTVGPWGADMKRMFGIPPGRKVAYSIHLPGTTLRCGLAFPEQAKKPVFMGARRMGISGDVERQILRVIAMSCSARLSYRYEWTIAIGYEKGVRILMPSDRGAVNELFKLRDIPDGRARRAALCNFVKSHWRRKKSGDKSPVREHIRGAEHFTWNGLSATIMPPAYDVSRIYGPDAPKVDLAVTR